VYVADFGNHRIRKVTPSGSTSTFAGSGAASWVDSVVGTSAAFIYPQGIAVDGLGNVFVADTGNSVIRKITPTGNTTTLAGNGSTFSADSAVGANASFFWPVGIAVDSAGNVFVADTSANRIRKISPTGSTLTLAGNGSAFGDGPAATAGFQRPFGIAVDAAGVVYVADTSNNLIRAVLPVAAQYVQS
jgi:sugar lactone lactonase YvrE